MKKTGEQIDLIIYLAIWDDEIGPTVVEKFPNLDGIDLGEISDMIFLSFQTIFGNSADVEFDRTNLILPLKSQKKNAKIMLDSIPNSKLRGGLQPFINVILVPIEFPEEDLHIFNEVQTKILDQYKKTQTLALANFESELIKTIENHAIKLFKHGNSLFKSKEYKDALKTYKDAVCLMQTIYNINKVQAFTQNLNKARIKYADQVFTDAISIDGKENYHIAEKKCLQAIHLAELAHDKPSLKRYRKGLNSIYLSWIYVLEEDGDKYFTKREYTKANAKYEEALNLARKSGRSKIIKQLQKKSSKAPNF